MLVLTRKPGEAITVNGPATIIILGRHRIGIKAPAETEVLRTELKDKPKPEKQPA